MSVSLSDVTAAQAMFNPTTPAPYRYTMLAGILISAVFWFIRSKRDPAMLPVYIGALGGAFLGAKLVYLFAEGWRDWPMEDRWIRLATGKSILGGLLGGYGGVELMKWLVEYKKSTGDAFALITPVGIAMGRVGCWMQGCCLGKPTTLKLMAARDQLGVMRWPSAQVELVFQLVMMALMLVLKTSSRFRDRLIFLYFIAYGLFRFIHEWMRDTPTLAWGLSGYQFVSLILAVLGFIMFQLRGKEAAA